VYRYCLRRLGSPEDAEDALQVTYLNAWRSLKDGCEPRHRRAWLFQIAANVCSSALRSELGRGRSEPHDPGTLDELVGVEDPESDELLGLSEALRELPSRQRRALVLRDWQGLSYGEIAAQMAVSDSAVETLLFRARTKLATALVNGEWRRRLAPSARALIIWPFAFLREKTAAITGAEHLKLGLGLAGGAVAPLIAFGVLQISSQPHTARAGGEQRVPAQVDRIASPGSWLERRHLAHEWSGPASTRASSRDRRDRPEGRDRPRADAPAATGDHVQEPASQPAATGASAAAAEPKIVLCHATASAAQPGVTISVSPHALAGLGDDERNACD
jgi:RNA polymerase sigma factor (sigma-70 family)